MARAHAPFHEDELAILGSFLEHLVKLLLWIKRCMRYQGKVREMLGGDPIAAELKAAHVFAFPAVDHPTIPLELRRRLSQGLTCEPSSKNWSGRRLPCSPPAEDTEEALVCAVRSGFLVRRRDKARPVASRRSGCWL